MPPKVRSVPRSSKKPKPTFDVAREPIAATKSGWVYRSEPGDPMPSPETVSPREAAAWRERCTPAEPHEPRFRPDAAPPPAERSWFATGVYLMVLPVSIGMSIMFAPVSWLLGNRSRH